MAAAAPGQLLRQGKSFDQMDPRCEQPSIHPSNCPSIHPSNHPFIDPFIFSEIPEFKPTGPKAADIEGETSGHTR